MKNATQPATVTASTSSATKACAAHNRDILGLTDMVREGLKDCTEAGWGEVANAGYARELLVRAAHALGQITEEEAATRYGVTL